MPSSNQTVLCRYHYDPLDRLASCSPAASDFIQRFYQKSRLTTEIQGQIQRSLVQTENQLLAQHTRQAAQTECALLGTDPQRSVLTTAERLAVAYTPYGTRHPQPDLPGFNGEQPDPVTGYYLLGNGYRSFNPVLMRFNSPDSLSPFGEGGINAYAYCGGDPVNRVDPDGHWGVAKLVGLLKMVKPVNAAFKLPSKTIHPTSLISDGPYERALLHVTGKFSFNRAPFLDTPRSSTSSIGKLSLFSEAPALPPRPGTTTVHPLTSPNAQSAIASSYDYVRNIPQTIMKRRIASKVEPRLSVWKSVLGDKPPMPIIFEEVTVTKFRRSKFFETSQEGQRIASMVRAARLIRAARYRP